MCLKEMCNGGENLVKVTVIGAGNSGLAMAAHLSNEGHQVTLWNRSTSGIAKLMNTKLIYCEGVIKGPIAIYQVTDDLEGAVEDTDIIMVTTPASAHVDLAKRLALILEKPCVIVLNPGRTCGAIEFERVYREQGGRCQHILAETQTIIYTCRKLSEDLVKIITLKDDVKIAPLYVEHKGKIISYLPSSIQQYFREAPNMIETSIGNVGMILHCAPLLLNTGWTESPHSSYRYYVEGITETIGRFIEGLDQERVLVSKALGCEVESTQMWLNRTYGVSGETLYQSIQENDVYEEILAPNSLQHRYIMEDLPCGLVPLEALGKRLGLIMTHTTLTIDLASILLDIDFRAHGRNLSQRTRGDRYPYEEIMRGGLYYDQYEI